MRMICTALRTPNTHNFIYYISLVFCLFDFFKMVVTPYSLKSVQSVLVNLHLISVGKISSLPSYSDTKSSFVKPKVPLD